MKKYIANLAALVLMATPVSSSFAQEADQNFMEGFGGLTTLEDYEATQAIFGSLDMEDEGLTMMYRIVFNDTTNHAGADNQRASSQFKGYMELNYDEKGEWDPFKNLKANAQGELRMIGTDDLYIKLDALNIVAEDAEDRVEKDLNTFRMITAGMTNQWVHISLADLQELSAGMGAMSNPTDIETLNKFKGDAEGMIRYIVETVATEQIRQFMYYESQWKDDNHYIDVYETEDYQSIIDENVLTVHPVDVDQWVEKGILNCQTQAEIEEEMQTIEAEMGEGFFEEKYGHSTAYDAETIENGFVNLACWTPFEADTSVLSEAEMTAFYEVDYGTGEWLYENGNWSYVVLHDLSEEPFYGENYLNYLDDAIKVDIESWREQGVLTCDDEVSLMEDVMIEDEPLEPMGETIEAEEVIPNYLNSNIQEGFSYSGCWYNYEYEGELTEAQQSFMDNQMGGEWIYYDGKWYFAGGVHEVYNYEEQLEAMNNFQVDPEVMEERLVPIRKGLDAFFDAELFAKTEVVSGPNEGFTFFRLKDHKVVELIQTFAKISGETLTKYDLNNIQETLNMFSLAGIYHVNETGILDNLFTRFRVNVPYDGGLFEMNYRFKLGDTENVSIVQVPSGATTINKDMLVDGLMSL